MVIDNNSHMKKTVGYSKSFVINGEWEKIWTDEELPEDTTPEEKRKKWYELRSQVHNFHFESNKAAEKQRGVTIVTVVEDKATDEEFEKVKKQLDTFQYKEDAEKYLALTEFNLAIEAKSIVNLKPNKPVKNG